MKSFFGALMVAWLLLPVAAQEGVLPAIQQIEAAFEKPGVALPDPVRLEELDTRRKALIVELLKLRRLPRHGLPSIPAGTNTTTEATNTVSNLKERISEIERAGMRRLEQNLTPPRSKVREAAPYLQARVAKIESDFANLLSKNTNWRHRDVIISEKNLVLRTVKLRAQFYNEEKLPPTTSQEISTTVSLLSGRLQVLADMELKDGDPLLEAVRLSFMENRLMDLDLRGTGLASRVPLMRTLQQGFTTFWYFPIYQTDDGSLTIGKLILLLLFIVLGLKAARLISRIVHRRLRRFKRVTAQNAETVQALVFYLLVIIVFFVSLEAAHVPLALFAVLGGALAVGIGFGSQNLVANFISGIILLFERPIQTGDLLTVDGMIGTVKTVGLRCTTISTTDGKSVLVPNSKFLESNVVNWTFENRFCRSTVRVGVAYGSDTRKVAEVLFAAASATEGVLADPGPRVFFEAFGDSSLDFRIDFWILLQSSVDQRFVEGEFRHQTAAALKANGFEVPFPQRDVHMKNEGASIPSIQSDVTEVEQMRPRPV